MVIFNRYKDTLGDFVDSSNIKLLNMSRLVDKALCNVMLGFEDLSTKPEWDENILNKS